MTLRVQVVAAREPPSAGAVATGVTRDQLRLEALLGSGKARAAALWLIKEGTKMGLNCNYGGVVFFRHAANDVQHDPLAAGGRGSRMGGAAADAAPIGPAQPPPSARNRRGEGLDAAHGRQTGQGGRHGLSAARSRGPRLGGAAAGGSAASSGAAADAAPSPAPRRAGGGGCRRGHRSEQRTGERAAARAARVAERQFAAAAAPFLAEVESDAEGRDAEAAGGDAAAVEAQAVAECLAEVRALDAAAGPSFFDLPVSGRPPAPSEGPGPLRRK